MHVSSSDNDTNESLSAVSEHGSDSVDESKVDNSKVDESKVDESKVDESKVDNSKVDESKVDESKVDESKVDESKVDNSNSDMSGFANSGVAFVYRKLHGSNKDIDYLNVENVNNTTNATNATTGSTQRDTHTAHAHIGAGRRLPAPVGAEHSLPHTFTDNSIFGYCVPIYTVSKMDTPNACCIRSSRHFPPLVNTHVPYRYIYTIGYIYFKCTSVNRNVPYGNH